MKNKFRYIVGAILLVSLIGLGFLQPVKNYFLIPNKIVLFSGQHEIISSSLPVFSNEGSDASYAITSEQHSNKLTVSGKTAGEDEMILGMGNLPIKKVDVKVLPNLKVYPGGQSIGVKLNTVGVLVVGHHFVDTNEGKKSPGEISGIKLGDTIIAINGESIEKLQDVSKYVNEAGELGNSLTFKVKRDNEEFTTKIKPLKDKNDQSYKLGLYIRDSAAGIGTLTFFHSESKKYGALGHVISDMDTKKPIIVNDGQILRSTVTSIEKGINGKPGEKLATFSNETEVIGNINKNSPFGIFGKLDRKIRNGKIDDAMPIALSHQVKEGPAKILTVVENNKVEEFDIEIVNTIPQKFPATKGMVIKITDKELLNKTGGIVQGMSGSPIIQDGKLVGAVTHVFVNDPTSGYGVHIEWMLNEAGIDIYKDAKQKAS